MIPDHPIVPHERIPVPLLGGLLALGLTFWGAPTDNGLLAWLIGFMVAFVAGLSYWNPWRGLGVVPVSLTAAFLLVASAVSSGWHPVTAGLTGATVELAVVGLWNALRHGVVTHSPRAGKLSLTLAVAVGLWPQFSAWFGGPPIDEFRSLYTLAAAAVLGPTTLLAWLCFFRPAFELACEPFLWLMYRIRGVGPGVKHFPTRGPCLVVANHACWFDPLFLAKVLPRPITPMMTSRFYDLPVLRWFLKRVFHAIRVPEQARKQDVPDEIREAIAALDRGECVVIFPEGILRRSEEKPLKRFGRGVWQILVARPETPVFACWIEGGWGSYCSYFNGKPTKNKRPDFRRRIGVAVPAPIALDAETLSNHLQTRIYLMNRAIESRKLLGLPDLPAFELPKADDQD